MEIALKDTISRADFRTQFMVVSELIMKLSGTKDNIIHSSPFSSTEIVRKSRFIESLMAGIPQGTLFIDGSSDMWTPIDCQFQVETLGQFVNNCFALHGLYFYGRIYDGYYFKDLPLHVQGSITNYQFELSVLNPGISPFSRFGVYLGLAPGSNDVDICRFRKNIFPYYQDIIDLRDKVVQNNPSLYGRRFRVERILSRLLVARSYFVPQYRTFTISIESLVSLFLEDPSMVSSKMIDSFAEVFNDNTIHAVDFRSWEKLDSFFAYLVLFPETAMSMRYLHEFETTWSAMPKKAPYLGPRMDNYYIRLDFMKEKMRL